MKDSENPYRVNFTKAIDGYKVTLKTGRPVQHDENANDLLRALKSLSGLELWILDPEMRAYFQETVNGAIKKATS